MEPLNLSHTSALILQIVHSGRQYGFDIMEATGLPSGTVYPALRRLEQMELVRSRWEKARAAVVEQRPPRKYYTVTTLGEDTLARAQERFPLLQQLKEKAR